MPLFQAALDDGADDGVQAGRVAAAGEHADTCDRGHMGESLAGSPGRSVAAAETRVVQSALAFVGD